MPTRASETSFWFGMFGFSLQSSLGQLFGSLCGFAEHVFIDVEDELDTRNRMNCASRYQSFTGVATRQWEQPAK